MAYTFGSSIPKSVVNMLVNVAGGWGANFTAAPSYVTAILEQTSDDALNPVHLRRTDEERRRDEQRILLAKRRHEEQERELEEHRNYQRQIEEHRPVVNHEEAISRMEGVSRKLAEDIIKIAEKGMCLSAALGYVAQIIQSDYGLDSTNENTMPRERILTMGRNVSTIPMVRLLCEHFGLSTEDTEAIVHNEMGKMYNANHPSPLRDRPMQQRSYAPGGALMGDLPPTRPPAGKPVTKTPNSPYTPKGRKRLRKDSLGDVIKTLQGLQDGLA